MLKNNQDRFFVPFVNFRQINGMEWKMAKEFFVLTTTHVCKDTECLVEHFASLYSRMFPLLIHSHSPLLLCPFSVFLCALQFWLLLSHANSRDLRLTEHCVWNIGTSSLGCWHKNSQETNADPCYLFITMASHSQGPHCPVGFSGKKVNEWYPQTFYCLFCFHVTFSSLAFIVKVAVINVGSFKHSEPQNDRRTWAHNKGYSDFQHIIASPCVSTQECILGRSIHFMLTGLQLCMT